MTAIITLCILGIAAGAGLGLASKKFHIERDPRREAVLNTLPGVNCGACGFAGCAGLADGIMSGEASPDKCTVAGGEAIESIAKIMGVTVTIGPKLVARVICCGDQDNCPPEAVYQDIRDCRIMTGVSGGGKPCTYGCMGGGSCVDACAYGALMMGSNQLPIVYEDKCIACGLCVKACPRNIMQLLPKDKTVVVACSSHDKGPDVRKTCKTGCIGCGICAKNCPETAITVTDFLASIDPAKCTSCGICVEKCPTKSINII